MQRVGAGAIKLTLAVLVAMLVMAFIVVVPQAEAGRKDYVLTHNCAGSTLARSYFRNQLG